MESIPDMEVFILYVIHHATRLRPFTEDRIVRFVQDADAQENRSAETADDVRNACRGHLRKGWAYTIRRRTDGSFQDHYLISPVGVEILVRELYKRSTAREKDAAMEARYRYANAFFGLRC